MPATGLIKPLLMLLCFLPVSAQAQTDSPVRWLDPANDAQNLPADGSILFWSGDQQIAGFRNIPLLSPVRHVSRGDEVMPLPRAERDFSGLRYEVNGESFSLADYMQHNHVGGLLVLNDGVLHDGTRLVPEGWIAESTEPSAGSDNYGYLWWLNGDGTFRASGIFGQGIYLSPEEDLVIVVQGAWPQATGTGFSMHRDGFFKAAEAFLHAD